MGRFDHQASARPPDPSISIVEKPHNGSFLQSWSTPSSVFYSRDVTAAQDNNTDFALIGQQRRVTSVTRNVQLGERTKSVASRSIREKSAMDLNGRIIHLSRSWPHYASIKAVVNAALQCIMGSIAREYSADVIYF